MKTPQKKKTNIVVLKNHDLELVGTYLFSLYKFENKECKPRAESFEFLNPSLFCHLPKIKLLAGAQPLMHLAMKILFHITNILTSSSVRKGTRNLLAQKKVWGNLLKIYLFFYILFLHTRMPRHFLLTVQQIRFSSLPSKNFQFVDCDRNISPGQVGCFLNTISTKSSIRGRIPPRKWKSWGNEGQLTFEKANVWELPIFMLVYSHFSFQIGNTFVCAHINGMFGYTLLARSISERFRLC